MDRIDALEREDRQRLVNLTGRTLDHDLDGPLQAVVQRVSSELGVPISLVSLVLTRTQYFRAHHGLPADLERAQATDRDVSFCQFVVRDEEAFEVNDAQHDGRVPQDLVQRYGISAYLGEPIRVGGSVVGTLCAIDVKPREFTPGQRATLKDLSLVVSARLELLAVPVIGAELLERGTAPAFQELRNILAPINADLSYARVALTDLSALTRLFTLPPEQWTQAPVLGALKRASEAVGDLTEILSELAVSAERANANIFALERAMMRGKPGCAAAALIANATVLAHHHTKVVGGVSWPAVDPLKRLLVSEGVGASVLSAGLSLLSNAAYEAKLAAERIEVILADLPGVFELQLHVAGLPPGSFDSLASELSTLLGPEPFAAVHSRGGRLVLQFAVASDERASRPAAP